MFELFRMNIFTITTRTIKNVTQTISQINANFVQSILTLVTICCNSTKARYTGEDRPRVKVTQRDIELSFLYDTGAQRSCMPFKAFKRIYGTYRSHNLPTLGAMICGQNIADPQEDHQWSQDVH